MLYDAGVHAATVFPSYDAVRESINERELYWDAR
jgi:hypothetical protein